jgi:uncharacterized cofD-like protein
MGGGHGLSQVLGAVKDIATSMTAIVTTTDNGGSTGRLRQDTSQIGLGDIRRCINSLAPPNQLLTMLGEQRFTLKNDLNNHCFGNILLSALCQATHNPTDAVLMYAKLLGVQHAILPMTDTPVDLVATTHSRQNVLGECEIDALTEFPSTLSLSKPVMANDTVLKAIELADIIVIGPGSLLTSVLPSLLIPNIRHALEKTSACRIYIENLQREGSVVDNIPAAIQTQKAVELAGFQFFDICFSAEAITCMDIKEAGFGQFSKRHSKAQIKHLIEQMTPMIKQSTPSNNIISIH